MENNSNTKPLSACSKPLLYDGIFEGMRVKDSDGDIGTIELIQDSYNISIKFDNGGLGYYCLNDCCDDLIYAII